jgi:lipoate-protein ligase A
MENVWRLIMDAKSDGFYNMAVDEVLLQSYQESQKPALRIYGWDKPFISLGYNQIPQEVLTPGNTLPFVRRMTGGAAILHDNELTYSLVCAASDLALSRSVKESYRRICAFLVEFYRRLGLNAQFACRSKDQEKLGQYGAFCFASREEYDLLIFGRKIGGNAQRRRSDVIFQHGSIPLVLNPEAILRAIRADKDMESRCAGLNEFLKREWKFNKLSKTLAESFHETFKVKFQASVLSDKEKELCLQLMEKKYKTGDWNDFVRGSKDLK